MEPLPSDPTELSLALGRPVEEVRRAMTDAVMSVLHLDNDSVTVPQLHAYWIQRKEIREKQAEGGRRTGKGNAARSGQRKSAKSDCHPADLDAVHEAEHDGLGHAPEWRGEEGKGEERKASREELLRETESRQTAAGNVVIDPWLNEYDRYETSAERADYGGSYREASGGGRRR